MKNLFVVTQCKMIIANDIKNAHDTIDALNENDCEYNARFVNTNVKQILNDSQFTQCIIFVHQMYAIDKMTFEIVICALREYVKKLNVNIDENELQTLYIYCENEHECMNDNITNNIATCVIDVDAHTKINYIG